MLPFHLTKMLMELVLGGVSILKIKMVKLYLPNEIKSLVQLEDINQINTEDISFITLNKIDN